MYRGRGALASEIDEVPRLYLGSVIGARSGFTHIAPEKCKANKKQEQPRNSPRLRTMR